MRHGLFAALCGVLLLPGALAARQRDTLRIPLRAEREAARTHYEWLYADNPALLSDWDEGCYSTIGVGFDREQGDFRDPQSYGKRWRIGIDTESILRQARRGWTFHGRFLYENGAADSVNANLMFRLPGHGSPSYFFCRRGGTRWDLQRYGLEASAAKRLGTRWSVGAGLEYTGELSFRKNDVRNDQTALAIRLLLSALYRPSEDHTLSLGFDYTRNKVQPNLSITFSHADQANYTIYLLDGMGTFFQNAGQNKVWLEDLPGARLQWLWHTDRSRLSVAYALHAGRSGWKTYTLQSELAQQRWSDYRFTQHEATLLERLRVAASEVEFRGRIRFIDGSNDHWNANANDYIQNYDYTELHAEAAAEWRPGRSPVRTVALTLAYDDRSRLDKNYDYRFDDSALTLGARLALARSIGRVGLHLDLEGSYRRNLALNHDPGAAASNLYSEYVGTPQARYLAADAWQGGAGLTADIPAGRNLIAAGIALRHTAPTGIADDDPYAGTRFTQLRIFATFHF